MPSVFSLLCCCKSRITQDMSDFSSIEPVQVTWQDRLLEAQLDRQSFFPTLPPKNSFTADLSHREILSVSTSRLVAGAACSGTTGKLSSVTSISPYQTGSLFSGQSESALSDEIMSTVHLAIIDYQNDLTTLERLKVEVNERAATRSSITEYLTGINDLRKQLGDIVRHPLLISACTILDDLEARYRLLQGKFMPS